MHRVHVLYTPSTLLSALCNAKFRVWPTAKRVVHQQAGLEFNFLRE